MTINEKSQFSDREIFEIGTKALINEIGYSGYLRFLQQIEHGGIDYLKIQEDLFKGLNVNELFEKAKDHWVRTNK
jgi:hypothetical protein